VYSLEPDKRPTILAFPAPNPDGAGEQRHPPMRHTFDRIASKLVRAGIIRFLHRGRTKNLPGIHAYGQMKNAP